MSSYIKQPGATFVKVHGSVDWARVIDVGEFLGNYQGDAELALIEHAAALPLTDDYAIRRGPLGPSGDKTYFPAIAVPHAEQVQFRMSIRAPGHSHVRDPRGVLVIGWAGADEHFLHVCAAHGLRPQRTLIVAGSRQAAQQPMAALSRFGVNVNLQATDGGFSDLMTGDRSSLDGFLRP